jgi:uncharacterized protein
MDNSLTHTQLIEKINAFLEKYQSDLSYCHGFDHVRRVAKLAVKIGTQEGADCQIVEIAALLHDIGVVPLGWSRHASGRDNGNFQKFLGTYVLPTTNHEHWGPPHEEVGALIADRLLESLNYPGTQRHQVTQIIREHPMENKPTTLESRIVYDADKLEALGATWIARAFQRTSAFDRQLGIESVPERYLNEKESILGVFHTETAKKMAVGRYWFLVSFNQQFQRELRMET